MLGEARCLSGGSWLSRTLRGEVGIAGTRYVDGSPWFHGAGVGRVDFGLYDG